MGNGYAENEMLKTDVSPQIRSTTVSTLPSCQHLWKWDMRQISSSGKPDSLWEDQKARRILSETVETVLVWMVWTGPRRARCASGHQRLRRRPPLNSLFLIFRHAHRLSELHWKSKRNTHIMTSVTSIKCCYRFFYYSVSDDSELFYYITASNVIIK